MIYCGLQTYRPPMTVHPFRQSRVSPSMLARRPVARLIAAVGSVAEESQAAIAAAASGKTSQPSVTCCSSSVGSAANATLPLTDGVARALESAQTPTGGWLWQVA